ncbi:hypothetical protein EON81_26750 [bacterium]|nr:MAG: hypothetical protein EON81_26750 [bacterium]
MTPFLLLVAQIPKTPIYRHVTNVRFAYAIDVPTFLVPGREPDNGDGRAYTSRDGTIVLRVFGSRYLVVPESETPQRLRDGFRETVAEAKRSGTVSLATLKPEFFAVSYRSRNRIVYQRTIRLIEGGLGTAILTYPAARQRVMDPVLTRTMRSLKALKR